MEHQPLLPIDHVTLSKTLNRDIKSPVYIDNLDNLGLDSKAFIESMSPMFKELPADAYDVKRQQIEWLVSKLPAESVAIHQLYKPYYLGEISLSALQPFVEQLSDLDRQHFDGLQPWRWRSVSQFLVDLDSEKVTRQPVLSFAQEVEEEDVRSWPRVFSEAPAPHVETPLFQSFLLAIAHKVQRFTPNKIKKIQFVVHFMSVKATIQTAGDNSPEGAHEDGADFIVSALVINRRNLKGGESQIIEKLGNETKEIIFKRILQPGEFVFQADTGEEKIYGNDLLHHVTPFFVADETQSEGWRDIIGFDINVSD